MFELDMTAAQEPKSERESDKIRGLWGDLGQSNVRRATLTGLFCGNESSFIASCVYRYFNDYSITVEYRVSRSLKKIHEIIAISPKTGRKHIFRAKMPYFDMRVVGGG